VSCCKGPGSRVCAGLCIVEHTGKHGCKTPGFGLAAVSWLLLAAVFIAELSGAYKPRHTWMRRFPLVLILAAELARFRCIRVLTAAQCSC
jgi:hypothetical protein